MSLSVLLVAPTCNRDDVGEAEVTYQWASRLAERHHVTLLTYDKRDRRASIADQIPQARVVQWSEPPVVGHFERFNSMLKPGYVPFALRVRRWVRAALRRGERFDVAHQLAPVALRYPSALAGLGIPYLVGPVGGSLGSPAGFADEEGGSPWYVSLRRLDDVRLRRDPLLRRGFAEADVVIGIGEYVLDSLVSIPLKSFAVVPDAGVSTLPAPVDRSGRSGPVRLLFVGRLVRSKGLVDAIRALSMLATPDVVLDVVGTGYQRVECEELARQLGLDGRVTFHGQVAHDEIEGFLRRADIFVFPSYREPGGIAVVEAMAAGLPCIVSDRGGPAENVDEASGIHVAARDLAEYPGEIARAIDGLVADPARREAMGEAARRRVADRLLWDRKVDAIDNLYSRVLAHAT